MLKEEEFRKTLMDMETSDDIYHVIEKKDAAYI
jgi:mannitol/fructose-specific phosphotransferase system IIA component (Ntr-type)